MKLPDARDHKVIEENLIYSPNVMAILTAVANATDK
jgi:hypothetical protein